MRLLYELASATTVLARLNETKVLSYEISMISDKKKKAEEDTLCYHTIINEIEVYSVNDSTEKKD